MIVEFSYRQKDVFWPCGQGQDVPSAFAKPKHFVHCRYLSGLCSDDIDSNKHLSSLYSDDTESNIGPNGLHSDDTEYSNNSMSNLQDMSGFDSDDKESNKK